MKLLKRFLLAIGCLLVIALAIPVGYYPLTSTGKALEGVAINENYQKGTIGAYIINLDRSPERLENIIPQIQKVGIPYARFPGVDGAKLSDAVLQDVVDFDKHLKQINNHPRKGTVGCTLSHLGAWKAFLESDYEYAFILEDDMNLDPIATKQVIDDLMAKSHLWDVVTLFASYDGMPLPIAKLQNGSSLSVYLFEIGCAGLYILNRKAAKAYLDKALPMSMSIDHMYPRNWEFDLKVTGVENPRVGYHGFNESVINATQHSTDQNYNLYERAYRGLFKLQTYVIKFISNLKLYFALKE